MCCRKDVLSARDEREWQSISATQSLSREGPLTAAQKRKKPLDLEEELRVSSSSLSYRKFKAIIAMFKLHLAECQLRFNLTPLYLCVFAVTSTL